MTTYEEMASSKRLNRKHWNEDIRASIAFFRDYLERGLTALAEGQRQRIKEDLASRQRFSYLDGKL